MDDEMQLSLYLLFDRNFWPKGYQGSCIKVGCLSLAKPQVAFGLETFWLFYNATLPRCWDIVFIF